MELRKNNLFKRLFVPNRKRKEWIWGYFLVSSHYYRVNYSKYYTNISSVKNEFLQKWSFW